MNTSNSDDEVVTTYSELYEEGEIDHINSVWPVSHSKTASSTLIGQKMSHAKGVVSPSYKNSLLQHNVGLFIRSDYNLWVGCRGTIDIIKVTFI